MEIPEKILLEMACEFNLGPEPIVNGKIVQTKSVLLDVHVRNMGNSDGGPDRWAIINSGGSGSCLNKNGEWEYQPSPSNRDEEFYKRCRYASVHEAIFYYRRWKIAILKWASMQQGAIIYGNCPQELLKFE